MAIRRSPKAHTPQRPIRTTAEVGAPPARIERPRDVETETLARMSDAFARSRPAAEPPTIAPTQSTAPATARTALDLRAAQPKTPFVRTPLGPKARLQALVSGDRPNEIGLRSSTDPKKLGAKIRGEIGPRSVELSAMEIAQLLGEPELASEIETLGDKVCKPGARAPHFLLAAHLSRWMEGIYPGATQQDVIDSFKAAQPEVAARFENLDAELLELLQQSYKFMPAWRTKPEPSAADDAGFDDWLDVPDADELYSERLSHALSELSEVPLVMALTNSVGERMAKDQRFAKHNVVLVQHMLGQANPFLDAMTKAGMEVDKAEYVGVPYQKNPAVKLTIEKTYGVDVRVPERGNMDAMWQAVCDAVDRAYERHQQNGEPILILDDGGYASKYIAQKYGDKAHLFKVVEQTTRGLTEIEKLNEEGVAIDFPILDVAGSYGKRFESAQVGDAVVQAIRRVLDEVAKTPARKDVLIVGAGKVGVGVANAFAGDGSRVTIFDPYLSPARVKQLQGEGFRVLTDKSEALAEKFLVVGCSGHRSINMDDFVKMSSPVFLASSSSKRVEIDTLGLKELATDKDGKLRRILAAKVNEQETWHYWTQDGRIVTTLADGLPVNFQDVNSIAPELIDHTMALMLLGAGAAVQSEGKGLVPLDPLKQFELQAGIEGIGTEKTSPDEQAFQVGDMTYFASEQAWRRIASSSATPPAVVESMVKTLTSHRGDGDMYEFDMSPTLLEALESPKELSDATVDRVLGSGFVPHIAHLARNPELSEPQLERVFAWVRKTIDWIDEGADPKGVGRLDDELRPPTGALYNAGGTLKTAMVGTVPPAGQMRQYSSILGFKDREVRAQLMSVLYSHAQCPQDILDDFYNDVVVDFDAPDDVADPARARVQQIDPATVHLLRNPRWTGEQLYQMATRLHGPLLALIPKEKFPERLLEMDPFLATQLGTMELKPDETVDEAAKRTNRQALYAYDVFDAIANHPNANDGALSSARGNANFVIEAFADQMVLRGVKSWKVDATGAAVPDYV